MQVLRGICRSGWQFAFAYCGLARSMNNNDPGYVNYEAIIYDEGERPGGGGGGETEGVGYCALTCSFGRGRIDSADSE